MLIVETDGHAAHSRQSTLERDHERDAQLRDANYAVLRFTFRQMTEKPGWVAASVHRELTKRASDGSPAQRRSSTS
jgi:very-short-patch-repair endonuclease